VVAFAGERLIPTNIISARPEMEGSSQKGNDTISKLLAAEPARCFDVQFSRATNYLLLCGKYTSLKISCVRLGAEPRIEHHELIGQTKSEF
jgi:hypothetical protein